MFANVLHVFEFDKEYLFLYKSTIYQNLIKTESMIDWQGPRTTKPKRSIERC